VTDTKRRSPYIWVTWLTKLLSGDADCYYQAWLKTHFKHDKLPEDDESAGRLSQWKAQHAEVVRKRVAALEAEGWTVRIEGQAKIEVEGRSAMVSGKPDILAFTDTDIRIEDVKTGKRRESDWWQVLIYMLLGPRHWPQVFHGKRVRGFVLYTDDIVEIPDTFASEDNQDRLWGLVVLLAEGPEPAKTPSWGECRWCDIASCDERVSGRTKPTKAEDLF
jgi:hypothetical protein